MPPPPPPPGPRRAKDGKFAPAPQPPHIKSVPAPPPPDPPRSAIGQSIDVPGIRFVDADEVIEP